jgi:hypothetical protein
MFWVESCLGLTVSAATVWTALASLSEQQAQEFEKLINPESKSYFWVVSDNVQAYAKKRDHQVGQPSKMVKGMATTAIAMEGIDPEAFDLRVLLDKQADGDCREL